MYKLIYLWHKSDGSTLRVTCYGFRNDIFKRMRELVNEDVCDTEIIWCPHLCFTFKLFYKCLRKEVSYSTIK